MAMIGLGANGLQASPADVSLNGVGVSLKGFGLSASASLGGAQSIPGVLRTSITAAVSVVGNLLQSNLIGAAISASPALAGTISTSGGTSWDYDAEYMMNF